MRLAELGGTVAMLIKRLEAHIRIFFDKVVRRAALETVRQFRHDSELKRIRDMSVERHWRAEADASGNALLQEGRKFFSQNDEDGIIGAILQRLRIDNGVFVEYGCGDGLENNTVCLLMRGWSGVWIGATDLKVVIPEKSRKIRFEQQWVTRENCIKIMRRGLQAIGAGEPILISVDLDGNDLFIVRAILESGSSPEVFVVEYNAKFPPPIRFEIKYDATFEWNGGDYFGASLQSFIDLFESFGYILVCCNITGANAFFVRRHHEELFSDIPRETRRLFRPPDYNWFLVKGHTPDPRSIEYFLR